MPNFSNIAVDYAKYRKGFPTQFFQNLLNRGIIAPNKTIVDLGTGTGAIARELALKKCNVIGIDPTIELIANAAMKDKLAGTHVNYIVATAEKTTLPDHSCDVVIVGQAWHWFDQIKAIAEIKRILKPDGSLIISHYEWVTSSGSVPELTEALMKQYNPLWIKVSNDSGIFAKWETLLKKHDLTVQSDVIDVMEQYTHEEWLGRVRASPAVSGVLTHSELLRFDQEHALLLKKNFPGILNIMHRCYILTANKPELILHNHNRLT